MLLVGEDPLQGDFPEVIEEYLEHGNMKCIAFNRRGTLLAGIPLFFPLHVCFLIILELICGSWIQICRKGTIFDALDSVLH